jgi:surface carbohydrate biosynthesis protein
MSTSRRPQVVLLVDNKRRDLMVAGLIAYQLDQIGIDCALEPLEATFAILAAYKPDMVIFNHLSASHLVRYSHRLRKLGVLVAVLPNEGLIYKDEIRDFIALSSHNDAHVDIYFCWNEPLARSIQKSNPAYEDSIRIVGIPRFDFYCKPWSILYKNKEKNTGRPKLLVCTNYVFAHYHELPPEEGARLFGDWASRVALYKDYRGAIATHHANRQRLFSFLTPLLATKLYDVILRPHPNETASWYTARIRELPEALQSFIRLEADRNITDLILNCDLEISMDTCTTALESWIANKPTIDLDMQHHPMLTNEIVRPLNVHCWDPDDLPNLVAEALAEPMQSAYAEKRASHLQHWCHRSDGTATEAVTHAIRDAIAKRGPNPKLSENLSLTDRRKGLKLKALRAFNLPYNWSPFLRWRAITSPGKAAIKHSIYAKTITPSDVHHVRRIFADTFDRD